MLIRDMRRDDASGCAAMVCSSEIGRRYGFSAEGLAAAFVSGLEAGEAFFVAEDPGIAGTGATVLPTAGDGARLLGFAWIDPRGAFSSAPYLRLIAVAESERGSGVGTALLEEFETRTAQVGRDWCLLVSDFNTRAQAFYESHGYAKAGALEDFARPGITEILMVKKRFPLLP